MLAFAVVADDEKFAGGDNEGRDKSVSFPDTDFVTGVFFGAVVVGFASVVVGVECGRFVAWVGPDREDAVFDSDAFAGEGDDALDNVLIANAGDGFASQGIAIVAIGEDNDFSARWDVFLAEKMGDSNRDAVDDNTVVGVEGVFHAAADDVVATEDKSVE